MAALNTLFPVFFMIAFGFLAKMKGWITPEQKAGANAVVFNLLFPVLILKIIASAALEVHDIAVISYVAAAYILAIFIGRWLAPKLAHKYAAFTPYMISVVEGSSVGLPLYVSIVGLSSNTVLFDIAGTFVCFIIIPIMAAKQLSNGADYRELLKKIITNPFILCVIAGLLLNLTGTWAAIQSSPFAQLTNETLNYLTAPLMPLILLILGYDFKVNKEALGPICKLMAVKTVYFMVVIAGFFVFFPTLMADPVFRIAPLLYFMCPTGFGLMPILEPLYMDEDDASFASAFVSFYMVVTLIVYTLIVLFIA